MCITFCVGLNVQQTEREKVFFYSIFEHRMNSSFPLSPFVIVILGSVTYVLGPNKYKKNFTTTKKQYMIFLLRSFCYFAPYLRKEVL